MASRSLARTGGVGRGSLVKLHRQLQSARASMRNSREKVAGVVETAVRSVEIGATAFALGGLRANGFEEVMGLPVDLLAAVAGHGAALLLNDDTSKHFRNAGDAALAVWAHGVGQETFGGGGGGGGATDETSGQGLPDRDLNGI